MTKTEHSEFKSVFKKGLMNELNNPIVSLKSNILKTLEQLFPSPDYLGLKQTTNNKSHIGERSFLDIFHSMFDDINKRKGK